MELRHLCTEQHSCCVICAKPKKAPFVNYEEHPPSIHLPIRSKWKKIYASLPRIIYHRLLGKCNVRVLGDAENINGV